MIIENTKENRAIKSVISSMAIENMFFDEKFINEILKVSRGEKSTEEIIKDIVEEYGFQRDNIYVHEKNGDVS